MLFILKTSLIITESSLYYMNSEGETSMRTKMASLQSTSGFKLQLQNIAHILINKCHLFTKTIPFSHLSPESAYTDSTFNVLMFIKKAFSEKTLRFPPVLRKITPVSLRLANSSHALASNLPESIIQDTIANHNTVGGFCRNSGRIAISYVLIQVPRCYTVSLTEKLRYFSTLLFQFNLKK